MYWFFILVLSSVFAVKSEAQQLQGQCSTSSLASEMALLEHACCPSGTTMAGGDCTLPSTCSRKCSAIYMPFFSGPCFAQIDGQMNSATRQLYQAFASSCGNTRCPAPEIRNRVAEVNRACSAGQRRALQSATVPTIPSDCSPVCAPVFSQFYLDCFEQ
eukprot:COSAG01_NODE_30118_length_622_cov_1.481836_1_plen_158_part_01